MAQDYGLLSDPWLNMGIGLLARSINQPRPVNTGEALLGGLGQYSKAIEMQRQAKKDAMVEEAQKQQAMMQAMQIKQMQDQMAREQAKQKWFEGMPSFIKSPSQQALAGGGGPTVDNAAKLPGLTPQLDQMAMIEYLSKSPDAATRIAALKDAAALQNPKRDVQVVGKSLVDLKTGKPIFTDQTPDPLSGDAELYAQAVKQGYKGSILDFVMAKAAAGRAPAQPQAPTMTEVIDPKDPTRMLRVNAKIYSGGSLGDAGVLGVSGKEPTSAAKAGKIESGKEQLSNSLDDIKASYDFLDKRKAISSNDRDVLSNVGNYFANTSVGQVLPRMAGTEEQTHRDLINSSRMLLLNDIKSATGMSAQQMNSNVELQNWLKALSDPTIGYQAATGIIENIRKKYVDGSSSGKIGASKTPMKGQVVDGYRFKGGNPADPANWEKQ